MLVRRKARAGALTIVLLSVAGAGAAPEEPEAEEPRRDEVEELLEFYLREAAAQSATEDGDPGVATHPTFRLGVDKPFFRAPYNFGVTSLEQGPLFLCLHNAPSICWSWISSSVATSLRARTDTGMAQVITAASSISMPDRALLDSLGGLGSYADLIDAIRLAFVLDLGGGLKGLLLDFHRAVAAVGQSYRFNKGCAEQDATVPAKMAIRYRTFGYLDASAVGAAFASSAVHAGAAFHTPGQNPDVRGQHPVLLHDEAHAAGIFSILSRKFSDTGWRERELQVDVPTGDATTYIAIGASAAAHTFLAGTALGGADFGGIEGADLDYITFRSWVDAEPPTTTAEFSGLAGSDGWFRSNVRVTLTAHDPLTCAASILYRVDGGSWVTRTVDPWDPRVSFMVAGEGRHRVEYRARDHNGNTEDTRTVDVNLDFTAPELEVQAPRRGHCYLEDREVFVTYLVFWDESCATGTGMTLRGVATDALSGIGQVEFYTSGSLHGIVYGPGPDYVRRWDFLDPPLAGWHDVDSCAQDRAGNRVCFDGPTVLVGG